MEASIILCRICFDADNNSSKLISPCGCRGSSKYVHEHCLERWQSISFENNQIVKAEVCSTCNHRYCYPNIWKMLRLKIFHRILHNCQLGINFIKLIAIGFIIIPIKIGLHLLIVSLLVLFPWKSIQLFGGEQLLWMGGFPPQIVVTSHSTVRNPDLRPGVLLIATLMIPESSCFFKAVILILSHSEEFGTKGVIINSNTSDTINLNRMLQSNYYEDSRIDLNLDTIASVLAYCDMNCHQIIIGFGGAIEREELLLLHQISEWSETSTLITEFPSPSSSLYMVDDDTVRNIFYEELLNNHIDHDYFNHNNNFNLPARFAQFRNASPGVEAAVQSALRFQPISYVANRIGAASNMIARVSNSNNINNMSNRNQYSSNSILHHNEFTTLSSPPVSIVDKSAPSISIPSLSKLNENEMLPFMVIKGHAFWSSGQLSGEIRDGYWKVVPSNMETIFSRDRSTMWNILFSTETRG